MKDKKSLILGIFIGLVLTMPLAIYGATPLYDAVEVAYDNASSGTSKVEVQSALDELYELSKTHCPEGYVCSFQSYPISYHLNGGTNHGSNPATYTIKDGIIQLKNPSRIGYNFLGWYEDENYTKEISSIDTSKHIGTINLYAKWVINQYTLTFNANGGSVNPTSKKLDYNASYGTLPTPIRTSYIFAGWFTSATGGTQVNSSTKMGAANTTIYAHWTAEWNHVTNSTWRISSDFSDQGSDATWDFGKTVKIASGSFRLRTAGGSNYPYKVYLKVNGSWVEIASGTMNDADVRSFGNANYEATGLRINVSSSNDGVMRYPCDVVITDYYEKP